MRYVVLISAVALAAVLIVFFVGYQTGKRSRPQPCVTTRTLENGHRSCLLDERDGAWVK